MIEENKQILDTKKAQIAIEEEKDDKYDLALEVLIKHENILKYCIDNN